MTKPSIAADHEHAAPSGTYTPSKGDFRWEGIPVKEYKRDDDGTVSFRGILRQTLFGERGESIGFEVRYFEIAPGGWSSLECHGHAHAVIGLRGRGNILLGDHVQSLGFLDLAYVGPHQVHRLTNETDEPFGFLCIVDAERDQARLIKPEELPNLLANPETAAIIQKTIKR